MTGLCVQWDEHAIYHCKARTPSLAGYTFNPIRSLPLLILGWPAHCMGMKWEECHHDASCCFDHSASTATCPLCDFHSRCCIAIMPKRVYSIARLIEARKM